MAEGNYGDGAVGECSPVWRKLLLCCAQAGGQLVAIADLGQYMTDAQREKLIPIVTAFEEGIERELKPIVGYPPKK